MKDFDQWNERKKLIDTKGLIENFFCKEREIWWCGLGINVGVEADGKNDNFERPVLILKVFNREMVWVLPITSAKHNSKFYYQINYADQGRWVIVSQIRTVSTKRLFRKIESLDQKSFEEIKVLLESFLKEAKPRPGAGNLGGRSPNA